MPAKRFLTLALIALMLLTSCTTGDGETDSDADGFSDKAEEEAGTDPNDNRSKPDGDPPGEDEEGEVAEEPEDMFEATETFAENGPDFCGTAGDADGLSEVACTGELDDCEAGMVGDLLAVRCGDVEARDGTVLSLAIQREAVAGGINLQWGCQAEPDPGTTNCIFNLFESGQIGEACEYEGEVVAGALVLSLPTTCDSIPAELRQRFEDSTDIAGQTSIAAAFLDDQDLPVLTRVGVTSPISLAEVVPVL